MPKDKDLSKWMAQDIYHVISTTFIILNNQVKLLEIRSPFKMALLLNLELRINKN